MGMGKRKRKATEEERRQRKLVEIVNMKLDKKRKIRITYFSNPLEKAPDRQRICPLSILPYLKPLD